MNDKKWLVESITEQYGKTISCLISEGTNSYGDGPERYIGEFNSVEDAELICKLHNDSMGIE